jgi:ferredoxin
MADAEIVFENEGLRGIVAVGSYLSDTARRFGIRFDPDCDHAAGSHNCAVIVSSGADNLSPLTSTETEHFAEKGRRSNERLACEARILEPGEIVIMTDQKKDEAKAAPAGDQPTDKFKQEFDALPLEKKIAYLMRMEAVTLGETFSYVVNSPWKVIEKVGDVMAEFGMKIEAEARKARRPTEDAPAGDKAKSNKKASTQKEPPTTA